MDRIANKYLVTLKRYVPIYFDAFRGMVEGKATEIAPVDKLYLTKTQHIALPIKNLYSFLCAQNKSIGKLFFTGPTQAIHLLAISSYILISPVKDNDNNITEDGVLLPFLRKGKPIKFNGFVDGEDKKAKVRVITDKTNLKKSGLTVPNIVHRPQMALPWSLQFVLTHIENEYVSFETVVKLFAKGGELLGLGGWRGLFGKFQFGFKQMK